MGGPVAGVLLREALTGDEAAAFDEWLGKVFRPFSDGLWLLRAPAPIGARPDAVTSGCFTVERGPWTGDADFPELPRVIGYRPAEEIVLCAMANGRGDHLVLGRLCLTLARRFGALVDFDGALEPDAHPPGVPYAEPDVEQSELLLASIHAAVAALPGTVHEFRYQTWRGTPWVSHVGDTEFLAAWLNHPRFHMIK